MNKCYIIDTSHLADKSNQVIYDMLRNQLANKELILFHQNNHNAINGATLSFHKAMGFSILPFSYIEPVIYIPDDISPYVKDNIMYVCESDIVSQIIQTMKPLIQISIPNHIEWLHNNRMNLFYWLVTDNVTIFSKNKYKKIQHWLDQDNFKTILNNKSQWQSLFHSKLHERKMKIAMILNGEQDYQDTIDKLIARRIFAELHQYFKLPIWFELIVHHNNNNNKNLISNDLSLAVFDEQLNYVHLTRKIVKLFTILTYAVMAQSQSKHLYHAWITLKERHQEVVDFIIAYMKLHGISVNVNNLPNFKKAWLDLFEIYDEHEVKTCFTNFLNGQPLKPSAIYEQPKPLTEEDKMDNPIEAKDFEGLVRPSACQRNDLTLNMNNLINEIGNHLCELFPQIQINHGQGSSLSSDSFAKLDTATQIWFSDVMQQSNNALKQNEQFQLHTLHMMMCDIVDDLRWIKAFLKHKPNLSYSWSLDTDSLTWQALHHHITTWARGWRESFGFKSDAEEQELHEQKAKEEAERLKQEEQQRQEMEQKEMNTAFENKIKAFEERRKQGLVVYNEITLLGLETVKEHIQMCLGVNYYDIQLGLIRVDDLKSRVWMRSNLEQIILKAIQDLMEQVDKYEPLTYLFRQNFEAEKSEPNKFVALTVGRNKEIKSAVSNGIAIFALMKQQFIIIRNLAQLIQFNISTPLDEPLTSLEARITGLQQQCHQQLNSL